MLQKLRRAHMPIQGRIPLSFMAVITLSMSMLTLPAQASAEGLPPPAVCSETDETISSVDRVDQLSALCCNVGQATVEVDGQILEIPEPGNAWVCAASVADSPMKMAWLAR